MGDKTMTSFQFWLALMTPYVSHPIFMKWGVWQPTPPDKMQGRLGKIIAFYSEHEARIVVACFIFLVILMFLMGFSTFMVVIVLISVAIISVGFPIILSLAGTIYGLASALNISGAIMNERLQGRYLILGVTPSGFLGASWALSSISVQNSQVLRQLRIWLGGIYGIIALIMLLPFIVTSFLYVANSNAPHIYVLWSVLIVGFSFLLFCLVDFFQSACVGSLVGIIAAHHNKTRGQTQNSVIANFLALQFGTYIVAGFICLIIIPGLFSLINYPVTPFYGYICVAVVYALREILIIILWHGLAITVDDDVDQLNRLTRIRIRDRSWTGHMARRLLRLLWRNPMD
jgi:hypothetical protein